MATVDWLLFDVGGVLEVVDDATWPVRFAERCAARLGLTPEALAHRLDAADLPDAGLRSGVEEEYWSRFGAALGADADALAAMRKDFWNAYCGIGNEVLLAEARSLVGRVGLAILSNSGDGARREEERRYGFAALFDPICYSHEMGVAKPDARAFEIALAAMGAAAGRVLFIDDLPANIEAARAVGMQTHRHTDDETTLGAIRAAVGTG